MSSPQRRLLSRSGGGGGWLLLMMVVVVAMVLFCLMMMKNSSIDAMNLHLSRPSTNPTTRRSDPSSSSSSSSTTTLTTTTTPTTPIMTTTTTPTPKYTTKTQQRQQYIIHQVPYLDQITDYSCGDASLNMVLSYYYQEKIIDQRSIIDVARTSNHTGTLSLDVVRSARFSPLSSTPTSQVYIQFPEVAPTSGWFNSKFANQSQASVPVNLFEHSGLVTLYYPDRNTLLPCEVARNDTSTPCWVDHLVNEFLKNNIPVICLMNFKVDSGGHYRVAVGYEFEKDVTSGKEVITGIIMLDPWDRNNNPTRVTYGVDLFCKMWKHAEPNDDKTCFKPYFGVAAFPLSISVTENSKTSFNIKVKYPCVFPPNNSDGKQNYNSPNLPLTTTIQHLSMEISALSKPNSNGKANVMFTESIPLTNTFTACDSHMLSNNLPTNGADSIRIVARGMVCDTVLPTEYDTNVWSPSYKYCDYIGGAIIHKL